MLVRSLSVGGLWPGSAWLTRSLDEIVSAGRCLAAKMREPRAIIPLSLPPLSCAHRVCGIVAPQTPSTTQKVQDGDGDKNDNKKSKRKRK